MKILIVGSGAREHGCAWALKKDNDVELFIAPGNAGMEDVGNIVPIKVNEFSKLVDFAKENKIDLTICIMDEPLVMGIVDYFEEAELKIYGPNKAAAIIEGSKAFSKKFMQKYEIPTAKYETFSHFDEALEYAKANSFPIVIKADGLAAGKGVIICANLPEAEEALKEMFINKKFGLSGSKVVIEEFLTGEECSILAFCDGKNIIPMPVAKDHKQIYDGGKGANTGGMGVFSPVLNYSKEIADICMKNIFEPPLKGLKSENRGFRGVLFFGLMLTADGPKVIEYNCRPGDPEFQTLLLTLETNLLDIILASLDKKLDKIEVKWKNKYTVCVVAASEGYPAEYQTGFEIDAPNDLDKDIKIFYAGATKKDNKLVTNGGRVLNVIATGNSLEEAREKAYITISKIGFTGIYYRKDIGA